MSLNNTFPYLDYIKEMSKLDTNAQDAQRPRRRRAIPQHPIARKRPFRARGRVLGRELGPHQPNYVQEHRINRKNWTRQLNLLRPNPNNQPAAAPPPAPPAAANGLRRSDRLAKRVQAQAQAQQQQQQQQQLPPPPPAPALSAEQIDINNLLSRGVDDMLCEMCQGFGTDPNCGPACYAEYLRTWARRAHRRVELRDTGALGQGYGLYVRSPQGVPRGECLGEYLGELLPPGHEVEDPRYVFRIDKLADIDARVHGNYTRYVNHHCLPNAGAHRLMVGGRCVLLFKASRDIGPDEQIFINYGKGYFEDNGELKCTCSAQAEPHIPPN